MQHSHMWKQEVEDGLKTIKDILNQWKNPFQLVFYWNDIISSHKHTFRLIETVV